MHSQCPRGSDPASTAAKTSWRKLKPSRSGCTCQLMWRRGTSGSSNQSSQANTSSGNHTSIVTSVGWRQSLDENEIQRDVPDRWRRLPFPATSLQENSCDENHAGVAYISNEKLFVTNIVAPSMRDAGEFLCSSRKSKILLTKMN